MHPHPGIGQKIAARPRHPGNAGFVCVKQADTDSGTNGGTQGTGFAHLGGRDRDADTVGENLRPMRAARTTARQDSLADGKSSFRQHVDMPAVFEHDTLE